MNIKIDYKNKLHSIGKDSTTIQHIEEAIKSRYPGEFQNGVIIAVIDNGNLNQIKNFQELLDFWKQNGSTASIKIKVFEAPQNTDKKQEDKQLILECAEPIYTQTSYDIPICEEVVIPEKSDVFEIQQQSKVQEQKSSNPFLKNKEVDEIEKVKVKAEEPILVQQPQKVQIKIQQPQQNTNLDKDSFKELQQCSNIFKPGNQFYEIVNKMIEERVNSILKTHNLIPSIGQKIERIEVAQPVTECVQKIEISEVKVNKKQQQKLIKQFKVGFAEVPLNIVKCEINSNYVWKVKFANTGAVSWPNSISVYKTSNKMLQITEVKSLAPGESIQIIIDMVAPSSKGVQLKQFRLGYFDQDNSDSLTFFGPKFGFQLDSYQQKKQMKNQYADNLFEQKNEQSEDDREMIKKIKLANKKVRNQKHNIDALLKKLKQVGIDSSFPQQLIVDMIVQLQTQKLD